MQTSKYNFKNLPKPRVTRGKWGILNYSNEFWTSRIFDSAEDAYDALVEYWNKDKGTLDGFKIVPIEISIQVEVVQQSFTVPVVQLIQEVPHV